MNVKATLKKLHQKFPEMSIDDLLTILDCFEEDINFYWKDNSTSVPHDRGIYCSTTTGNIK